MLAARAICPKVQASFQALEIANTVWAYATLGVAHPRLMDSLAQRAMMPEVFMDFNVRGLHPTPMKVQNEDQPANCASRLPR